MSERDLLAKIEAELHAPLAQMEEEAGLSPRRQPASVPVGPLTPAATERRTPP